MKNVSKKQTRFLITIIVGLVVGIVANLLHKKWQISILAGWDCAVIAMLVMLWRDFSRHTAEQTATIAKQDDMNRSLLDVIMSLAAIASLGAVVILLTGKDSGMSRIAFGLVSIVLSWILVHALYTLRYAALYYRNPVGGVDFNSSSKPDFKDFAYLAFTIGMTYQVSDTSLTSKEFRRTALHHALLSFVFGTSIIAVSINLVASIVSG